MKRRLKRELGARIYLGIRRASASVTMYTKLLRRIGVTKAGGRFCQLCKMHEEVGNKEVWLERSRKESSTGVP